MIIVPLLDRVLLRVRKDARVVTKGGIVIPEAAKERSMEADVVAVGPGAFDHGIWISPTVGAGDVVLIARYTGVEVMVDGEEFIMARGEEILAVLK